MVNGEINYWFILGLLALNSLSIILAGVSTGYLVFRAKRDNHDRLFPKDRKRKPGPINIDEFAKPELDEGLPDLIMKQNEKIVRDMAMSAMKSVKASDKGDK